MANHVGGMKLNKMDAFLHMGFANVLMVVCLSVCLSLSCVTYNVQQQSRICIVGPNGAGKSTLLNLIMGVLQPTDGVVNRNRRMRMGRYSQHFMEHLPMLKSPVDYLRSKFDDQSYQEIRNLLGNVGLEGHAHTIKNKDLSGGQKARVVFAELMLARVRIVLYCTTLYLPCLTKKQVAHCTWELACLAVAWSSRCRVGVLGLEWVFGH